MSESTLVKCKWSFLVTPLKLHPCAALSASCLWLFSFIYVIKGNFIWIKQINKFLSSPQIINKFVLTIVLGKDFFIMFYAIQLFTVWIFIYLFLPKTLWKWLMCLDDALIRMSDSVVQSWTWVASFTIVTGTPYSKLKDTLLRSLT